MRSYRRFGVLFVNSTVFSVAGILAWLVRSGFEAGGTNFKLFLPYVLVSASVALVVFLIFRLHLHFFRFFSAYDFAQIAGAIAMAVLVTVLVSFLVFRLENVQRSMPFLHFGFALGGFMLLRVGGSMVGARREKKENDHAPSDRIAALVIGYTSIADLFLRSVPIVGGRPFHIAGILDERVHYAGQRLHQKAVIGHPVQLEHALAQLLIQGIAVRKVFLCIDRNQLEPRTIAEIDRLERAGRIELHDYAQHARAFFDLPAERPVVVPKGNDRFPLADEIKARAELANARYGMLKRSLDIVIALVLGAATLPIMLIILPAIQISMGSPTIFWQERPGHNGKVFRLFKLRTLSHGVDQDGRILDDDERQTFVGRILRRTRLDEIPQLLNVLAGDMSFIGPRPLLPVDLPSGMSSWNELRASVRPGLTGWAQVNGGQEVSKEDKVVMDVYYIANMSLLEDVRILFLTVKTVVKGEKLDHENIGKTYDALGVVLQQDQDFQGASPPALVARSEEQSALAQAGNHPHF